MRTQCSRKTLASRSCSRQRINPVDYLKPRHGIEADWITFDPTVRGCNDEVGRRKSGSNHDGTLLFTFQNIDKILEQVVARTIFRIDNGPEKHEGCLPAYTLGWVHLMQTSPVLVDLPCGHFPGQHERVKVSYRVHWVKSDIPGSRRDAQQLRHQPQLS